MNFNQAVYQMTLGEKVRLSDWTGYWFLDPKSTIPWTILSNGTVEYDRTNVDLHLPLIRVFTREGDILDTPNFDRYKGRDDWEIVTEVGFSFDMALRFLKNNKTVRRTSWDKNIVLFMEYGALYIDLNLAVTAEIYDPNLEDIMASNWEIAPE